MTRLIIGLGNIGLQYENSRHNVGFDVVDAVAEKLKIEFKRTHRFFFSAEFIRGEDLITLVKPTTYMNRSGWAVEALSQDDNFDLSQCLIVVDDFNLPFGKVRFRKSGSDGGHNGLESITETLGTENFPRLRLGIGPVPENIEITDFVLGQFEKSERKEVENMIKVAAEATIYAIEHDLDLVMTKYNNSNPA